MLGTTTRGKVTGAVTVLQQTRNISKRRIAYPPYPFKRLTRQNPKKHDSNLKYAMRQFLGPKNYKGEYALNKYNDMPNNHEPNYLNPRGERGVSLRNPLNGKRLQENMRGQLEEVSSFDRRNNDNSKINQFNTETIKLQPFPLNPYCKTNYMISNETKLQIFDDIENKGLSSQQVSQKYGLKIPRVEAIVRLLKVENKWENKNMISPALQKMSSTLYNMLPLFQPDIVTTRENLSEIPVPPKTLKSRFVTIAESEPFGPVDAANVLELEPAMKTLERLSTEGEHSAGHSNNLKNEQQHKIKTKIVLAELRKGDRSRLKFKDVRAENVAYRYGSVLRDNKKDRVIGFNELGHMVYM
ncbi:similar to Saccharomyces cerevisiae YGR165W MRPS35 Mitochondrial ribosomal protein of the small subunit [Maudiozyma saulgeensis]|uniref:Similar to Saccharomyces cerevisiae YGR165W MRPS35 Mitochondrial ribosomal protein of the small subunit n=1 Tax=Maudiozyma saulgeensis TaxID=1789683 RepID=A0A1X7R724_9SACH|nr:similar to Saccharomyces cerevisiae YGR165W MRPS35 Mitochondrial ribosomal protein of the small subunit [Kazachstania saulgeensis]